MADRRVPFDFEVEFSNGDGLRGGGFRLDIEGDDTTDGRRPAPGIPLRHDIPIAEHLCALDHLPDSRFRFFAVPVKVRAFGTFPVRAFAVV